MEQGAYPELSEGRTPIRIAEPGTYRTTDPINGRSAGTGRDLAPMIQDSIAALAGRRA